MRRNVNCTVYYQTYSHLFVHFNLIKCEPISTQNATKSLLVIVYSHQKQVLDRLWLLPLWLLSRTILRKWVILRDWMSTCPYLCPAWKIMLKPPPVGLIRRALIEKCRILSVTPSRPSNQPALKRWPTLWFAVPPSCHNLLTPVSIPKITPWLPPPASPSNHNKVHSKGLLERDGSLSSLSSPQPKLHTSWPQAKHT